MKLAPYRPSKRHVWEVSGIGRTLTEHCKRCGCYYVPAHGGIASLYCSPKPQWLKEHPDDDLGEF